MSYGDNSYTSVHVSPGTGSEGGDRS
jgi:hypothetical protein